MLNMRIFPGYGSSFLLAACEWNRRFNELGNSLRNNRTDKVEVNEDTEVSVLSDVKNSHVGHMHVPAALKKCPTCW
jgi:hypothetical protein